MDIDLSIKISIADDDVNAIVESACDSEERDMLHSGGAEIPWLMRYNGRLDTTITKERIKFGIQKYLNTQFCMNVITIVGRGIGEIDVEEIPEYDASAILKYAAFDIV